MEYCGQFGEPEYLDKYFNNKTNGIAIEVGAYDGKSGSNTYFFEKYRNWSCLCIEPVPHKYEICKRVRKNVINGCAGKENTTTEFSIVTLDGGNTSAISSLTLDERLIESHKHLIQTITKIKVDVKKLTDILDDCNFPRTIDFVSIDTENTEIDVLHGFDLNKYDVKILLIENNFNENLHYDYVKQFGYKKIARLGVNDIYEKQASPNMVEVSIGELVDKYSILEIKSNIIKDTQKLQEVNKEKKKLSSALTYINSNKFFYKLLVFINNEIWTLTDRIKQMENLDSEYASVSKQIFINNQVRFRLKNYFNILNNSVLKEQKSYSENSIEIKVKSIDELILKIEEINYLCITNDNIVFNTDSDTMNVIRNVFKNPNISYNNTSDIDNKLSLAEFSLNGNTDNIYSGLSSNRGIYLCDEYITYNIGGRMGDFIHSLYIVYNNFLQTGKRGLIYMSTEGDGFRKGILNTYKEIYHLIRAQPYVYDLKIHNNDKCDINLNKWRDIITEPHINHVFCKAYNQTYNIDNWGVRKWIFFDNIISNNYYINLKKYENIILINTTSLRFPIIDINPYVTDNTYFISFDENEYAYFLNKTNIKIPLIKLKDIYELCYLLSICSVFIGSYSMPLALAKAMKINTINATWDGNDLYV